MSIADLENAIATREEDLITLRHRLLIARRREEIRQFETRQNRDRVERGEREEKSAKAVK